MNNWFLLLIFYVNLKQNYFYFNWKYARKFIQIELNALINIFTEKEKKKITHNNSNIIGKLIAIKSNWLYKHAHPHIFHTIINIDCVYGIP